MFFDPSEPSHPVGEPMIKLTRGFLRTCGVSVSAEDCIFLGIVDGARAVRVRYTCKEWVHFTRRQGRIRYGAEMSLPEWASLRKKVWELRAPGHAVCAVFSPPFRRNYCRSGACCL
jgi:hypothetical protein